MERASACGGGLTSGYALALPLLRILPSIACLVLLCGLSDIREALAPTCEAIPFAGERVVINDLTCPRFGGADSYSWAPPTALPLRFALPIFSLPEPLTLNSLCQIRKEQDNRSVGLLGFLGMRIRKRHKASG